MLIDADDYYDIENDSVIDEDDYVAHYGTLHKSGRYVWGSGETQSQRNKMFLDYVKDMKRQGLTDAQIGKGVGLTEEDQLSSTRLRALQSIAKAEQKQSEIALAQRLKATGMSNGAIGIQMARDGKPLNESSVRALLAPGAADKADNLQSIAAMLKGQVAEKKYVDVGTGNESHIGTTDNKLRTALAILQEEGYEIRPVNIPQLGTNNDTRLKVLCAPGTTQKEVWENKGQIQLMFATSDDSGRTYKGTIRQEPIQIDPSRVAVRYGPDGGSKTDGVLYVRQGVPDVSLGAARYAQVRMSVGPDHFLKGMAMYKDKLPDGIDVVFNTNKMDTGNKFDAMKKLADETGGTYLPSVRRQLLDKNGKVSSAMNLVNEEGEWQDWSKTISTQVLSKQSHNVAKHQLDMRFDDRRKEYEEIVSLTNPTVRKHLLKEFSESVDSSAVHLEAARVPRMGWHAILPIDSMPRTQIYAPNFEHGETVALIRYPHGGKFEIPELIVNNNHPESKRLLGINPKDAVGIHHSVAQRLSGADFDGDTVLVIPNGANRAHKLQVSPALEHLKNFDPREEYKEYPGMIRMTKSQKGMEMGLISNLITDMTIKGAGTADLARAIKHSMVVIDAEKHGLNYKLSAEVNGIKNLKIKYQGGPRAGAATLISRAGADKYIDDRKDRTVGKGGPIDPVTGQRMYEPTNRLNYRTGALKKIRVERLSIEDDAHALVSTPTGTNIERLYADHSNRLKSLANQSRLEMINTPPLKYSGSAAKTYAAETKSLKSKLEIAIRNRPLERQAQVIGNTNAKIRRDANPNMEPETYKKIKFQALEEARNRIGAGKTKIVIDQKEWDAIQAGAISNHKLDEILTNADMDRVRTLATPRTTILMSTAKTDRARQMLDSGYSRGDVARQLGVSLSTLDAATTPGGDDDG